MGLRMVAKKVEERLVMVEEQIGSIRGDLQRFPEMEKNVAALKAKLDLIINSQIDREANRRKSMKDSQSAPSSMEDGEAKRGEKVRGSEWRYEGRGKRLEMPVFDGSNPDGWVFRAERFFNMNVWAKLRNWMRQ